MTKKQETLVIKIDWWLWRVIAMSWAITEKAKRQKVKVITSRPLVFRWNPYIESVHGLDDRRLFQDVIKWNDYIEIEPYTDPRFFNDAVNRLEIVADKLDVPVTDPCLFLAEHEKIQYNLCWNCKNILFQPFWSAVNDPIGADKSYRSLYVKDAQYIADKLIWLWYKVWVVERENQPRLNGCEHITTPDMRFVVWLCSKYDLIGIDSCLHHASKAFGRKATVIRAGTDTERYWYASHINMREFPMVEHTPMRLPMNDFNFDISNQNTNKFSQGFLDQVVENFDKMCKENCDLSCKK